MTSPALEQFITESVKRSRALDILKEKRGALDRCARHLLEKETLTGEEVNGFLTPAA